MYKLKEIICKKLFFKILITLFCTGGMTYHSFQLFNQYMSGKTVVSIEVGRVFNDTLPGITICYPFAISLEKLSKLDKVYYNQYEKFMDIFNKNKNSTELKQIYDNMILSSMNATNSGKLKFSDIFLNSTIKYSDFNEDLSLTVMVDDLISNDRLTTDQESKIKEIGEPVQSTAFFMWKEVPKSGRCFTYFSSLLHKWRRHKRPFQYIYVRAKPLNYSNRAIPKDENILVSIHSPNR